MSEYDRKPLRAAVASHCGGGTPPRQVVSFWQGEIPWASVKDFSESACNISQTEEHISRTGLNASTSNLIPAGTPLVCTRMAVGRAALPTVPMAINQDVKALFPAAGVSATYLLKLLKFIQSEAEGQAVGSTVKGIRIQDYLDILVPLAPTEAQPVIAQILDTVDTAIRETEAIIAKLKAVKQGLLHDLLTRGIDATGELRPPQSEAPHLYKKSPLGWIPKEWNVVPFRNFAEKIQDGTHFSPEIRGEDYLYVTSKNIRFGYLDLTNVDRIDKVQHDAIYRRCNVKRGDLLLTKDGANTGNAALNICSEEISLLSSVAFIRFQPETDTSQFFLQYLLSPIAQQRMKDLMSGNAITRLTLKKIRSFEVLRPSYSEQKFIADILFKHDANVVIQYEQLQKLEKQRSGFMDDLLTGRVRVTSLLEETTP